MTERKENRGTKARVASGILAVTGVVVLLDQYTKYLAVSLLSPAERVKVIPGFFDLTLTFNKGVAFGLFSSIDNDVVRYAVLGVTTVVALGAVLYFFLKELSDALSGQFAFALIVGGAMGNIIDRVRLGAVVDFFLAYYQEYHWPVFNLADSCISVGVAILLLFHSSGSRTAGKSAS